MAGSWLTTDLSSAGCKVALQGTPPKLRESAANSDKNLNFPVDFFEYCRDLIDVYPKNKLKTRLDQNAMYIISEQRRVLRLMSRVTTIHMLFVVCELLFGAEGVEKTPAFDKVRNPFLV